jgi:BlaI family penicillinase repressor
MKNVHIGLEKRNNNMDKKYGLSPSEYEIMEYLWEAGKKVYFKEIFRYFSQLKGWKKQTLSTYLTKMINEGLLMADKEGKFFLYYPVCSKEEHIHRWTKEMINSAYGNSLGTFMAAFSGGDSLSDEDIEELKLFLQQYGSVE